MPFSSLNGFQDPNWMYQTNSFSDAFGGVQEMVPLADEKPQFPMNLNFDLNDVSNPDWLHDASSLNLPGGSELPAAPQFDANPQTIQPSLLEKTDPELERLGMPRAGDAAAAAPKQTLEARIGSLEQRLDGMEEQIRYIAGMQDYIKQFQAWTVEFKQTAETLARELRVSPRSEL